jgi:hypothetical protein
MSFKWEHNKDDNLKIPNPKGKIKWEKIDIDLYRAMVTERSTALYERMRITTISSQEAITQVNTLLTSAAQICSRSKAAYHAKPKLKVWNADTKVARKEKRNSYNIWLKNGKPNDPTNHLLLQKKHTKKEFRRTVRIEVARQKEIEKVYIMEARSNNMELFHKLIQKNRRKGLEHIQDINVNGKTYSGSDEVILGFQEHFRSLSTFDKSVHKEITRNGE